ncbi:hypothetical protein K1719_030323 [Acacia pycnantha]|nr:hypothetical protein K1719_030323 [Acacia pycnantha]
MRNLRVLNLSKVHLLHNLNSLPSALKFLSWDHYALESLPSFDQLYELECLQLCNSKIRKLWNGAPFLGKLRIIDLSDSDCLIETLDFSATPNLEELVLTHCSNLVWIHESVGLLKKLVKLRLDYCKNLVTFPSYLETDNLEEFILGGCINLEKLPEFGRNMTCLYFLDVRSTRINEIPWSIIHLINLKYLDVSDCNMLQSMPELPPNLIICGSNCPLLKLTGALGNIYARRVFKGPTHVFYDYVNYPYLWKSGVPSWFKEREHLRSADQMKKHGEIVGGLWNARLVLEQGRTQHAWLPTYLDYVILLRA